LDGSIVGYDLSAVWRRSDPVAACSQISQSSTSPVKASKRNVYFGIWSGVAALLLGGYWISAGRPDPILFFSRSVAESECISLADRNRRSLNILQEGEIQASSSWIEDGVRVVLLSQRDGTNIKFFVCLYGRGRVYIPTMLDQRRCGINLF
jgi:hypothetical protein